MRQPNRKIVYGAHESNMRHLERKGVQLNNGTNTFLELHRVSKEYREYVYINYACTCVIVTATEIL